MQVDQIIHQNWNGGDVTFKNIGTLNAYAQKTAFLIQSQPNNFAALNINNVDVVNIMVGQSVMVFRFLHLPKPIFQKPMKSCASVALRILMFMGALMLLLYPMFLVELTRGMPILRLQSKLKILN